MEGAFPTCFPPRFRNDMVLARVTYCLRASQGEGAVGGGGRETEQVFASEGYPTTR